MNTKHKGDIAEQAAVLHALRCGWGVLKPIGDNLSYDLVFDIGGRLAKVQVKSAWLDKSSQNYVVDNRRTKTNRRQMKREEYSESDFDFALVYLQEKDCFYIFPVNVFINFGSEIHMVEVAKRQRVPKSAFYRDAWNLILQWAMHGEICAGSLVKVGEATGGGNPEPRPEVLSKGKV